ncbi:MAG: pentapeptide repeat-containing protein [Actinomycetes bacterium]
MTAPNASAAVCPSVDPMTGDVTPTPSPDVDWSGCNLAGANLASADLRRANLSAANLSAADLDAAVLIDANLTGASLTGASLSDVNLTDSRLGNAKLTDANLNDGDLRGADLTGADLGGVSVARANLIRTTQVRVRSGGVTGIPTALPTPWVIVVGYLVGPAADLSGAALSGADLSGTTMTNADLSGADLSAAIISDATLDNANFSGADLRRANLTRSSVTGANLSGANLARADLRGSNLNGVDLTDAGLAYADVRRATLVGASLAGADLDFTDLTGADLTNASGCQIRGIPLVLPTGYSIEGGCLTYTPPKDTTPPVVTCNRPAPRFRLNKSPATVTATLTDETAPASTTVSANARTSRVGPSAVTVSGQDAAGNPGSARCSYRVVYGVSKFRAPVNNGRVVNKAIAGRKIPFNFSVFDANGAPVRSVAFSARRVDVHSCQAAAPTDRIEIYTPGLVGLTRVRGGDYRYVFPTRSTWAGTCRTLSINLGDGVWHSAQFRFTR